MATIDTAHTDHAITTVVRGFIRPSPALRPAPGR
jgi:hypothetical protein